VVADSTPLKVVPGPFDAVVSLSRRRLSLQLKGNYAGSFAVAVGRQFLYEPFWGLHAAHRLGIDPDFRRWPHPYAWWLEKWDKGMRAREAAERGES
jgi:hypothetical protein